MFTCLLLSAVLAGDPPDKARDTENSGRVLSLQEVAWRVDIVDRAHGPDNLYYCVLRMRGTLPVDGISLLLRNRKRQKVGEMPLTSPLPGINSVAEGKSKHVFFLLHRELLQHSVLSFEVYPEDHERSEFKKVHLGKQLITRRGKDGKVILERIDWSADTPQ